MPTKLLSMSCTFSPMHLSHTFCGTAIRLSIINILGYIWLYEFASLFKPFYQVFPTSSVFLKLLLVCKGLEELVMHGGVM